MQQYRKWLLLLLVSSWFVLPANGQHSKESSRFRIVGYYSLQASMTDSLNVVPFDQLTHINLWFLNPDSAGEFSQDLSTVLPFISAAHAKNVKVLASIGGGSPHPYYHGLLKDDARKTLV